MNLMDENSVSAISDKVEVLFKKYDVPYTEATIDEVAGIILENDFFDILRLVLENSGYEPDFYEIFREAIRTTL